MPALKVVGNANGANLLEMMAAMNQVKSSPLVDAERSENHVRDAAAGTEERLRLVEKSVDSGQVLGKVTGKVTSADWGGNLGRSDSLRGHTTAGEDAEGGQKILADTLLDGGPGACGRAFGKACIEGCFGRSVSKAKVLDDLLDAPLL